MSEERSWRSRSVNNHRSRSWSNVGRCPNPGSRTIRRRCANTFALSPRPSITPRGPRRWGPDTDPMAVVDSELRVSRDGRAQDFRLLHHADAGFREYQRAGHDDRRSRRPFHAGQSLEWPCSETSARSCVRHCATPPPVTARVSKKLGYAHVQRGRWRLERGHSRNTIKFK